MSEQINQRRQVSGAEFVPTFPQSLRDTNIQQDDPATITRESVLQVIAKHEPIKRNEIAAKLNVAPAVINWHLSKLKDTDKIFQNQDGAYLLTDVAALSTPAPSEPVEQTPEEQRMDVIGQNGNDGEHYDVADAPDREQPTRSLDEPTAHLSDPELTSALELITLRLKQPIGITPLSKDDPRVMAFRGLLPILADDIAQAVGEILDHVTGCAA